MRSDVKRDKERAERHNLKIKAYLGQVFIGEAPARVDMEEATDLLVFEVKPFSVACRVRSGGYFANFHHQFTVRYERASGMRTEHEKILDGWADYMFYGFEDVSAKRICAAHIFDLNVFREVVGAKLVSGTVNNNYDGRSSFVAYNIADFPKRFVVSRYNADGVVWPKLDGRRWMVPTGTSCPEFTAPSGYAPEAVQTARSPI